MKKFNRDYVHLTISLLLAICGGIAFYYLLFHTSNLFGGIRHIIKILMPAIYGFALAYILAPALDFLELKLIIPLLKKLGLKLDTVKSKKRVRSLSVILTMALFFVTIYIFILLIVPSVIESIKGLINGFPVYIDNFSITLSNYLKDYPEVEKAIDGYLDQMAQTVEEWLSTDLMPQIQKLLPKLNDVFKVLTTQVYGVLKFLLNIIVGLIISIYLLTSKETFLAQIKKVIYSIFSERKGNRILYEMRIVHKTFGGFIIGKIVDSIIIGIICYVACTCIGTPYASLVSVIVGITNIIPFFGPFLGAIPSVLIIVIVDPRQAIYFLIMVLVLQQLDGNIIGPFILGESTGLSGMWVIIAITLFGGLWGVMGMFIGVPLFAVIYNGIKRYCVRILKRKQLPTSTIAYLNLRDIQDGKLNIVDNIDSNLNINLDEDVPAEPVKITIQLDTSIDDKAKDSIETPEDNIKEKTDSNE